LSLSLGECQYLGAIASRSNRIGRFIFRRRHFYYASRGHGQPRIQKLEAAALLSESLYAAWFMAVGSGMLFHLWRSDDDDADSYWVGADTAAEARRLVALNVGGARDAEDPMRFDCEPSKRKRPPAGFIHRRLTGPVAIQKR
jgi:hypothetical protein